MTERTEAPMPSAKGLDAAVDFFWPTYRPNVTRAHVKMGDIQCQRLGTAFDDYGAARVTEAIERLNAEIHKLCPETFCQDGMLYGPDGKTLGACEWRGHILAGHT